jgi:hypothetical protein
VGPFAALVEIVGGRVETVPAQYQDNVPVTATAVVIAAAVSPQTIS